MIEALIGVFFILYVGISIWTHRREERRQQRYEDAMKTLIRGAFDIAESKKAAPASKGDNEQESEEGRSRPR